MTRIAYGRSLFITAVFLFFAVGGASAQSFEDQDLGDWSGLNEANNNYSTSVGITNAQASDGTYSAEVTVGSDEMSGSFHNDAIEVQPGDILEYHVWIPSGELAQIDALQPYVQSSDFNSYDDDYYSSGSLSEGQWITVDVEVPSSYSQPPARIALQINGTQDSDTPTIYVDEITRNGTLLPVELTSFNATLDGNDTTIQWQTASETNNAGFDLLHEAPGTSSFDTVTFVDGAGTTTSPQSYSYRLTGLSPGTHRFRLQQEDLDGSTTLTDPISVEVGTAETELAVVGTNPFRTSTQVRYGVQSAGTAQLTLYDVLGRKVQTVFEGRLSAASVQHATIDGADLSAGVYFLRLQTPTATKTQQLTIAE